jgi:hypothetical protein
MVPLISAKNKSFGEEGVMENGLFTSFSLMTLKTGQNFYCISMTYKGTRKNRCPKVWIA